MRSMYHLPLCHSHAHLNSVHLLQLPTGLRVQCHETRSRALNALKARRRMQEKVSP